MSLPPSYSQLVTVFEAKPSNTITYAEVRAAVISEDTKRKYNASNEAVDGALLHTNKLTFTCHNCGKPGHKAAFCCAMTNALTAILLGIQLRFAKKLKTNKSLNKF